MNESGTHTDQPAPRKQSDDVFEEMKLEQITQTTYQPTPYEDSSYEIVGEPPSEAEFLPMIVKVVGKLDITTDPMFADYGGLYEGASDQRWHLPDHLAYRLEREALEDQQTEPPIEITKTELAERLHAMREEGYNQGFQDAASQAEDQRNAHARQITELLRDIGTQVREELARLELSCVSVAIEIAERLIRRTVEINPEYLLPVLQEAFELAAVSQIFQVRVSPQDYEFVEVCGVKEQLGEQDETWTFVADETIKAGCIVETSSGEIDFQIDKAFERVKDEVIKVKV